MKIAKIAGAVVVSLIVLFFVVAVLLPKDYDIKREIMINAPVETVFPRVANFENWAPWSPWLSKDVTIINTYTGEQGKVGAQVSWTSQNSGNGLQFISALEPNSRLEMHLDFGEQGQADSYWIFAPMDSGTHVTWGFKVSMDGFVKRYFGLMMENMVGADYELGLSLLKKHVESLPPLPVEAAADVSAPTDVSGTVTDATGAAPVTPPAQ